MIDSPFSLQGAVMDFQHGPTQGKFYSWQHGVGKANMCTGRCKIQRKFAANPAVSRLIFSGTGSFPASAVFGFDIMAKICNSILSRCQL
jgi:hypothetical protein